MPTLIRRSPVSAPRATSPAPVCYDPAIAGREILAHPPMVLPSPPDDARGSRPFLLAFKVLVSATLLIWLLSQADLAELAAQVRHASAPWLAAALLIYFLMIVASAWRWGLLLATQRVRVPQRHLVGSFLVATFFNNFLPSNIGGDVVRVRDTAADAGSVTRATAVVVVDRALGLLALLLVGALAATFVGERTGRSLAPIPPALLWLAFAGGTLGFVLVVASPALLGALLQPVRWLNHERLNGLADRLTGTVAGFAERPWYLASCFLAAIGVQAILVGFYVAVAWSLRVPISPLDLGVVVPVSFILQLLPVSLNGFGVREAAFSYYFAALNLPVEGAIALSLVGAGLILLFSLSGGLVFVVRSAPQRRREAGGLPRDRTANQASASSRDGG